MTENTTPKQNPLAPAIAFVAKHKTKLLVGVAATSVAVNVLQGKALSQHNAFLKENGLFDAFYDIATNEVA